MSAAAVKNVTPQEIQAAADNLLAARTRLTDTTETLKQADADHNRAVTQERNAADRLRSMVDSLVPVPRLPS